MCRTCFWSALVTRQSRRVWCAHKVYHGWHVNTACKGEGYKRDPDT